MNRELVAPLLTGFEQVVMDLMCVATHRDTMCRICFSDEQVAHMHRINEEMGKGKGNIECLVCFNRGVVEHLSLPGAHGRLYLDNCGLQFAETNCGDQHVHRSIVAATLLGTDAHGDGQDNRRSVIDHLIRVRLVRTQADCTDGAAWGTELLALDAALEQAQSSDRQTMVDLFQHVDTMASGKGYEDKASHNWLEDVREKCVRKGIEDLIAAIDWFVGVAPHVSAAALRGLHIGPIGPLGRPLGPRLVPNPVPSGFGGALRPANAAEHSILREMERSMRREKSRHKHAVGVKRQQLQQRGQQESTDTSSTISSIHASTDMTMMDGSGFALDLGPGLGRLDTLDSTAGSLGFLGDTDCSNGSSISIGSGKSLERYFAADECPAEAADAHTGMRLRGVPTAAAP